MTLLESFQWWFLWHPAPWWLTWFCRGMESQIWPLWLEIHTNLRVDTWNLGRLRADYSLGFFLVGWACIVCFFVCLKRDGYVNVFLVEYSCHRDCSGVYNFVPIAIRMRPTYLCLHTDFHRWQCVFLGGKGKDIQKQQVGWGRFSVTGITWFQDLFTISEIHKIPHPLRCRTNLSQSLEDVPPFPAFFWRQKWPGFLKRQDGLVGRYPEDKAIYEERAPICHTDQLSCPILLLQGDEETW